MYQPQTYGVALLLVVITMFCWGSWANTLKACPGYRFQLFYWDYLVGLLLGALLWGLTLGSLGTSGNSFLHDLSQADRYHLQLAITGGVIFNIANLLLVAAIEIAGLAVAFPIGIGLALIVGAVTSYLLAPHGNPYLLFGGIALVMVAIVLDALAYRLREAQHRRVGLRGVGISLIAGLLMGSFYPFVSKSMSGTHALGPYAVALVFAVGVALCALPVNFFLMRKPLDASAPITMTGFWTAPFRWHLWGVFGGLIWCTGAVFNFVASQANVVGPAVSYSIGQGATMVSAAWGVFIWREFAEAPPRARSFVAWMFLFFFCGLLAVALAPLH